MPVQQVLIQQLLKMRKEWSYETINSNTWFLPKSAYWYFNGLPSEPEEVIRFKNCQVDEYDV